MKIRVPMMIQDPKLCTLEGLERIREKHSVEEDFFLDGPVSRRVAILDLDPKTGKLEPGVPFRPPTGGQTLWRYVLADEDDIYAHDAIALSVFGTVLRTMYMFEESDALGRKLVWGFDGPQLLVIPRAGERANAFYQRASRSLQFFFFPNPRHEGDTVSTSLSRDIVAHETGHAILDGIAPGLYNAITPQSLALHEGVADLTAGLMAFRSHTGIPPAELLDQLLPGEGQAASDGRPRYAVVSTAPQTYSNVPDPNTLVELRGHCTLFSTQEDVEDAGHLYIDLEFEGGGTTVRVQVGGSPA